MRNKTAIVTGGASGIGRALGEAMARRGAHVVLADRQLEQAREVAEGIVRDGGNAYAVTLDVRDPASFKDVAEEARARTGSVDYLFNNAGIGVAGEAADYDRAAWDDVLDVNVRGVAYGVDAVYPIMRAQGSGHIINTASMAGLLPAAGAASYTTSKHAVVGMSKALRIEAEGFGVRVSALCPGVIRTPILTGGEFGRKLGVHLGKEDMMKLWERLRPMDPDKFAVEVLADVDRNEPYIIVPRWWKALWALERVAPRLSLRLWTYMHGQTRAAIEASGVAPADEVSRLDPAPLER